MGVSFEDRYPECRVDNSTLLGSNGNCGDAGGQYWASYSSVECGWD